MGREQAAELLLRLKGLLLRPKESTTPVPLATPLFAIHGSNEDLVQYDRRN
eukprot:CAMPEP_0196653808 /NCGR_PEP_ID=MMETSP1086-20130531/3458_1 /TAXON_ID=77921 /ORGANISM="Cyanoptyche  gloeocystis , Strain SAG4.97" /LENGTH=50 /DNA_ID=CAMNT_0041985187 /DNA_START=116 /DNA_END=268 /DNA_ORIENTATION=+